MAGMGIYVGTSGMSLPAFEAGQSAHAAIAVRRWDEAAKDPSVSTPRLGHFRTLLERVAAAHQ